MEKQAEPSSIPQYILIQEKIKQLIKSGEIRLGGKLPPENVLASQFNVSRMTLRHALDKLVADKLIEKKHGLGSFITNEPEGIIAELTFPASLTQLLVDANIVPSSKTLASTLTKKIPSRASQLLQLERGEAAAFIERVRYGDKVPIAINQSWLPDKLVPGLTEQELVDGSIIKTLIERYHVLPIKGTEWVEPTQANSYEAEFLEIPEKTPLLLMTTISYLANDTPIEYSKTLWRGDRLRLQINSRNFDIALR